MACPARFILGGQLTQPARAGRAVPPLPRQWSWGRASKPLQGPLLRARAHTHTHAGLIDYKCMFCLFSAVACSFCPSRPPTPLPSVGTWH